MKLDDTAGMNSRARKIETADVYAIRRLFDAGATPAEIVETPELPISHWQTQKIGERRMWKSLPEQETTNA